MASATRSRQLSMVGVAIYGAGRHGAAGAISRLAVCLAAAVLCSPTAAPATTPLAGESNPAGMATPAGLSSPARDASLLDYAVGVTHLQTATSIEMRGGGIAVSIQRNPWSIQVSSVNDRNLLNEVLDPPAWQAETPYGTLGFEAGGHWYHAAELTTTQFTKSGAILTARTADPRAMNDQLHDLGYKVLGYLHPNLRNLSQGSGSDFSATFRQLLGGRAVSFAAPEDLLIKHPDGSPYINSLGSSSLDLSDPRAVDWWRSAVQSVLRDYDFDGWMQDFGEQAPEDGVYASGLPGIVEHNRYPARYAQATFEAAVAVKPDFVTFARSATVGSTPYLRLTWTGDQSVDWSRSNGLPAQIPAMLSGAMSGIPNYAPDVAGYYDPDGGPLSLEAEKELWMRWVELGALSPTFRDILGARHIQNVNLWTDAETLQHFRKYARLHNSLVPYFYSFAREASERGYPIMRHLFLDYPDDPHTYTLDDQYLLGDALLVCPVVTPGASDRSCYLPAGDWVDFWTGEMYRGAGYVTLPAPAERIPLLVRAGALLPTAAPTVETFAGASASGDDLVLRIMPSPEREHTAEFRLYDGTLLRYAATPGGAELHVDGSPVARHISVESGTTHLDLQVQAGGNVTVTW